MPEISVIIPAYNAAGAIARCLESLTAQTFGDFEVIVVNDGSTDDTAGICGRFCSEDPRFRLVSQPNSGVSEARNRGLADSHGELICFVDADDYVDRDYLQALRDAMEGADLAVSGLRCVYDGGGEKRYSLETDSFPATDPVKFHALIRSRLVYGPCDKLFRKSVIDRYGIRFQPNISYGEDRLFNYEYLWHVSRISTSEAVTYNYVIHQSDSLSSRERADKFDLEVDQWSRLYDLYDHHRALSDESSRDLCVELFWIIADNLMAVRQAPAAKRYGLIRHILSKADALGRFTPEVKRQVAAPRVLKGLVLNRLAWLSLIYVNVITICER
jgi:glycosyltransferase involved in cell wall biosynthesis